MTGALRRSTLLVAVVALAACGGDRFKPPERTDAVRAEEARIAELVERTQRWTDRPPPKCRVRLLGQDGDTSYVWAGCTVPGSGDAPEGGWSVPYRIDGTTIRDPADGAGYADSVEKLFPDDMADAILEHRDDLLP